MLERSRTQPFAARRMALALVFGAAAAVTMQGQPAWAGHPGSVSPELSVVGRFDVPFRNLTTDVWAYGNYAYIGSFDEVGDQDLCSLDLTGVRVLDISDPTNPSQVAFIKAKPGTRNNDVKVEHIATPHFTGEILVVSNEKCEAPFLPRLNSKGKAVLDGRGGISIWDVTNPAKPRALKQSFLRNQIHNTFIWQQGSNAYLIAVDDEDTRDVIIVDITKPQSPKEITRTGAPDWPAGLASEIEGPTLFLHDVWVQENNGQAIAYLSYWDAGLVLLDVTDPANPVFLGDSTYPNPDVVSGLPTEGNGHVAVPSELGDIVIFGDEDQSKNSTFVLTTVGTFKIGVALFGPDPLSTFPNLPVHWTGGNGCTTAAFDRAAVGPEIALIQRGTCFFSTKAANAEALGYAAYIVASDLARAEEVINMSAGTQDVITIPGIFVAFASGETMKPGANVTGLDSIFDGEGFMRVIDATDPSNMVQLGHFATEGVFSLGQIHGDRTAHNVVVRDGWSYWSWYYEGMRVVDFSACLPDGGFESCTPAIAEVAHYKDDDPDAGANFWGVFLHDHPDGNSYILASDRHGGLWIFADPGSPLGPLASRP